MATSKNIFFETVDYKLFVIMAVAAVIGGYLGPQIAKRISPSGSSAWPWCFSWRSQRSCSDGGGNDEITHGQSAWRMSFNSML